MLARDALLNAISTEKFGPRQLKSARDAVETMFVVPSWSTTKKRENVPYVKGNTNARLAVLIMLRSSRKVPVRKFWWG